MADEDSSKPSVREPEVCGWVHHVGWNESLDAIERHTKHKLDLIDKIVDAEVKEILEEAEKVIASLDSEDSNQESIEVDKYEALAKAQQKLLKIYKEGPPSKLAVVDELKTMVDDCMELFDFNESGFKKFSNIPIEEVPRSDFIEAAIYTPCLALSIIAFAILILV